MLCSVQDGTTKASLELKNERVQEAFALTESDITKCKEYCLKYGTFMNPSSAQNFHYKDVVSIFKKYTTWQQMIFYCKPYCKVQNSQDKKNQAQQNQVSGYQETISRPAFITGKNEKEVFLNGEVNNI